jgi:hypothetical protein
VCREFLSESKGLEGTYYCGLGWGMGTAACAMILAAVSAFLAFRARSGTSFDIAATDAGGYLSGGQARMSANRDSRSKP